MADEPVDYHGYPANQNRMVSTSLHHTAAHQSKGVEDLAQIDWCQGTRTLHVPKKELLPYNRKAVEGDNAVTKGTFEPFLVLSARARLAAAACGCAWRPAARAQRDKATRGHTCAFSACTAS